MTTLLITLFKIMPFVGALAWTSIALGLKSFPFSRTWAGRMVLLFCAGTAVYLFFEGLYLNSPTAQPAVAFYRIYIAAVGIPPIAFFFGLRWLVRGRGRLDGFMLVSLVVATSALGFFAFGIGFEAKEWGYSAVRDPFLGGIWIGIMTAVSISGFVYLWRLHALTRTAKAEGARPALLFFLTLLSAFLVAAIGDSVFGFSGIDLPRPRASIYAFFGIGIWLFMLPFITVRDVSYGSEMPKTMGGVLSGLVAYKGGILTREIAARRKAEEELRSSEARFRGLFENAVEGVFQTTVTGEILTANPALVRMLGYESEAELRDVSVSDLYLNKSDRDHFIKTAAEVDEIRDVEIVLKRKDGQEMVVLESARTVRDEQGGVLHYEGRLIDITERKRAEMAVEAERDFANSIIATVPSPLLVLDEDLRVVAANQSFCVTFQVAEKDTVGSLIYELGNRQWDISRLRNLLAEVLSEGVAFEDFELEHHFETIGRRVVILSARGLQREAQDERLILLALEDVTERKRADDAILRLAEDLARSNDDLAQFAYVASHDLQEPLRMVSSYLQLLEKRYEGKLDADADEFIAYAVDGANRMSRLIHDLLEYARVGTRGKEFVPTDCGEACDEALNNLKTAIEESGAEVTRDSLPTLSVDPVQLGQLFQNLIGNGIKFRGEKRPQVHVSADEDGGAWKFSVRDNGIGIEQDHADRIFVIFQRLHGREEYPGTGIGLAVSKRIVERHGGTIWMESEPEKGSSFYFTLPSQNGNAT